VNERTRRERTLRDWLSRHYGIIGRAEATRLGATPSIMRYKLDSGEWARLHPGVYRDTATPASPYQNLRAAWVSIGGRGLVSARSSTWLWDALPEPPPPRPDMAAKRGQVDPRNYPWLTIHLCRDLDLTTGVLRHGIMVTNPLRTLVDLAAVAPPCLDDAIDRILAQRLVTPAALEAELRRLSKRGRTGVGVLRSHLLDRGYVGAPSPSVLEARMWRLVRGTGLALPEMEVVVHTDGSYRLDVAWRLILLAVEVDGYAWHFSPEQMSYDTARRNLLQAAGWTVLVYTWRHVTDEPLRVAAEITSAYRRLSRPA
jgi:very-short-patch-repair endonuclease